MIRLRRSRPEQQGYTQSHIDGLMIGFAYFGEPKDFFDEDGSTNEEAIILAWTVLKSSIMASWDKPGRRPWAWWAIDSPVPRDLEKMEAEQLHELGKLTKDEYKALELAAKQEHQQIHYNSYCNVPYPFRRSWLFWQFISSEPRNPSITEYEQLKQLDELTPYEQDIRSDPQAAMRGGRGHRSRFYYLTDREMSMLGLPHKPLTEAKSANRKSRSSAGGKPGRSATV